jgi:hypothetical protein
MMPVNALASAGSGPVQMYEPRRIAPTTAKDPINGFTEVERWDTGASDGFPIVLVGSADSDEFVSG